MFFRTCLAALAWPLAACSAVGGGGAGADAPSSIRPLRLAVGEYVFDALSAGDPAGELVLLLHGFPQTGYCYRAQLSALAAAGYHAVAPDQRGYSPDARPAEVEAYAMGHLVEDVVGFADRLGAERFHLVGHDWGGAVAWVVATRYPERVRTLTVLSTPHFAALSAGLADPDSEQARRSSYFSEFAAAGAEVGFLEDGARRLREVLAGSGTEPGDQEVYVRALGTPAAMRAALAWYAAMQRGRATSSPASAAPPPVPPVRVPTLYVWGTADAAFARAAAEGTAEHVAGPYTFVPLDGRGHWLPEEAAAEVDALLLTHLAGN